MYDLYKDMLQRGIVSSLSVIKILFVVTLKAISKRELVRYEMVIKIEVCSMYQSGRTLWNPAHRVKARQIHKTRAYLL